MRYSTVPAINLEAHVARNRSIIRNAKSLPESFTQHKLWADGKWIINPIYS